MSYAILQYDQVSEKQWQREHLQSIQSKKAHFVQRNKDNTYHRLNIRNNAIQKAVKCILKCWKKKYVNPEF